MSEPLMPAADRVVTKGQFAAMIGVSPGRISQMIAEGKISGDALDGEGRSAKIRVETARGQLRARTDLGQRFGNGIGTRLDGALFDVADAILDGDTHLNAPRLAGAEGGTRQPPPAPQGPPADPVADRLKAIKLEEAERRNREAAEEELARRGVYVRADQSRASIAGVAVAMLNVFEGGVPDLAQALAEAFELPQRDLAHVLRGEFRKLRIKAATAARARGEALPELIEDSGEQVADAEEV